MSIQNSEASFSYFFNFTSPIILQKVKKRKNKNEIVIVSLYCHLESPLGRTVQEK